MIKNKLIVFFMMFFIGIVFANELYIQYVDSFDGVFYYVSFYPEEGKETEMLEAIEETAADNNLKVFFVDEDTESTRNQHFQIYANETVREYLEKQCQMFEGKQTSLFSGTITVDYYDYHEIPAKVIHAAPDGFRLIGEYENMYHFKQLLIDEYAGGFPHTDDYNSLEDVRGMLYGVWVIVALVILLTEYYLINVEKKEIFVRFTVGQPLLGTIGRCILRDCGLLAGSFGSVMLIAGLFVTGVFEWKTMLAILVVIAVLISIFYLRLYWYDVSEVMSNTKITVEMVVGNYLIKCIVFVLVICMISVNIVAISQWMGFDKQKDLFAKYKDSYYINFYHKDNLCEDCELVKEAMECYGPVDEALNYAFFVRQEKLKKAEVCEVLTDELGLSGAPEDTELLYVSSGLEEYLKSKVPELKNVKEDVLYILAPESIQCTKEEQEELFCWFDSDVGNKFGEYEKVFIEYTEDVTITSLEFESELGSGIQKNPVIAFETVENKEVSAIREWDYTTWCAYCDAFVEASEEEIETFMEENNLCDGICYNRENVWESYTSTLTSLKRIAIISIVIIALMAAMLIFVNQMLLRMLYNGFGLELAVKKVSGYSLFERFRIMFILDVATGIMSVLAAYIVCRYFHLCNPQYIVVAGAVVIGLEVVFLICHCRRMDREKIQKILKGGSL